MVDDMTGIRKLGSSETFLTAKNGKIRRIMSDIFILSHPINFIVCVSSCFYQRGYPLNPPFIPPMCDSLFRNMSVSFMGKELDMGRTLPSASILFMQAKAEYLPFQRALVRSDQLAIDELFIYANKHIAEAAYAASQIPMETYMVAAALIRFT
jgi:hypothetical protein